jgi:hypothetical protein
MSIFPFALHHLTGILSYTCQDWHSHINLFQIEPTLFFVFVINSQLNALHW